MSALRQLAARERLEVSLWLLDVHGRGDGPLAQRLRQRLAALGAGAAGDEGRTSAPPEA